MYASGNCRMVLFIIVNQVHVSTIIIEKLKIQFHMLIALGEANMAKSGGLRIYHDLVAITKLAGYREAWSH